MSAMKRLAEELDSQPGAWRPVLTELVLTYAFGLGEAIEVLQAVQEHGPATVSGNRHGKGLRTALVIQDADGSFRLEEFG